MIPFIDLAAQQAVLRSRIDAAVSRVLNHGKYIMGPEVTELEKQLAAWTGSKHCLSCSSGTDALLMALMAWDIGPGCAVFTTPFTFVATAEVIRLVGATPVFADIDPVTYNLDLGSLRQAIETVVSERKLCPAAIISVDLFGLPCDYEALRALADEFQLKLLQDASQAFGATEGGRVCPVQGDIGVTSFFPAKPLGCYGDGGAVFTDNPDLARIMDSIRLHGKGIDTYHCERVGINGRMDTLQAAILLEKLTVFGDEVKERQRIASAYGEQLRGASCELVLPVVPSGKTSVWAQYTLRHPRRDALRERLKEAGIPTMVYYPLPIHLSNGYREARCPVSLAQSEAAAKEVFSLPFHPYLRQETQKQITESLLKHL